MPERRASAHASDDRFPQRERILANAQMPLRARDFSRREKWQITPQVATEKVVDVVLAGIHSGLKRGPGYRRNRGKCCCEAAESSHAAELGKMRQLAFVHEAAGQFRIHSVETHDDDSLHLRFALGS